MQLGRMVMYKSLVLAAGTLCCAIAMARPPEELTLADFEKLRRQGRHKEVITSGEARLADGSLSNTARLLILLWVADSYRMTSRYRVAIDRYDKTIEEYFAIAARDKYFRDEGNIKLKCDIGITLAEEEDDCPMPYDSKDYLRLAWKYENGGRFATARRVVDICFKDVGHLSDLAERQRKELERMELSDRDIRDFRKAETVYKKYWPYHDVATLLYIKGEAYEREADVCAKPDDPNSQSKACCVYEEAIACFATVKKYPRALCFDPEKPCYWKVCEAVDAHIEVISRVKIPRAQAMMNATENKVPDTHIDATVERK